MRQLLRRALAIAVTLSVMLSTLGVAHASCDAMGRVPGAAAVHGMGDMVGDMDGMAHHDAPMPATGCDHGPATPADHGGGSSGCMLVAHCGVAMLASGGEIALSTPRVQAYDAPTDDAGPLSPALEPDSPPPRA